MADLHAIIIGKLLIVLERVDGDGIYVRWFDANTGRPIKLPNGSYSKQVLSTNLDFAACQKDQGLISFTLSDDSLYTSGNCGVTFVKKNP